MSGGTINTKRRGGTGWKTANVKIFFFNLGDTYRTVYNYT